MRVALVVERFEAGAGGVENVAWRVAHGLRAAGDDVRVVARRASKASIPVHEVSVPTAWQPVRVLAFSRAAARAAPRGRPDVVYSFARTRHQDVYRAGGGSHADYLARRKGGAGLRRWNPRHAVLLANERRVFGDESQLVVCVSEMVRDELRRRYGIAPERLSVLWNGVDLDRFHPGRRAGERARVRKSLSAGDEPVWLFAGSGFERKGLDVALSALARSAPGAHLWIAGRDDPAPWRRRAERLGVADRVAFLGFRADPEVLYAAADALLLPTRYDAFANVCLEAAAAGLPCVTSGANGAAGLLGPTALRVDDPEDVDGFAAALNDLREPALRERLGAAARARAEAHGWDAHVTALRELLAAAPGVDA